MTVLTKPYIDRFNKVLVTAYDYFDKLGIKPIFTQHTLLGFHRDGGFLNRPNDCIDIMCLADDLTPKVQKKFRNGRWFNYSQKGKLK